MVVPALVILYNFGTKLHVYLDNEDTHIPFIIAHMMKYGDITYEGNEMVDSLLYEASNMDAESMNMLAAGKNFVNRDSYDYLKMKFISCTSFYTFLSRIWWGLK